MTHFLKDLTGYTLVNRTWKKVSFARRCYLWAAENVKIEKISRVGIYLHQKRASYGFLVEFFGKKRASGLILAARRELVNSV